LKGKTVGTRGSSGMNWRKEGAQEICGARRIEKFRGSEKKERGLTRRGGKTRAHAKRQVSGKGVKGLQEALQEKKECFGLGRGGEPGPEEAPDKRGGKTNGCLKRGSKRRYSLRKRRKSERSGGSEKGDFPRAPSDEEIKEGSTNLWEEERRGNV